MCVNVRERLHKGAHLVNYMAAYKDSCLLCCISCILEGKFSKEFQNAISCNKTMHGTAATGKFTPCKNVIYTLGVKSI